MAEIQEFKGNKVLCLNPESKFTFTFGVAKAKMILENIDVIKKFVETNGESLGEYAKPKAEGKDEEVF